MKLNFKKWIEVMSQGGVLEKERPDTTITALNVAGYNSQERPPTKANNMKMKKTMKKH